MGVNVGVAGILVSTSPLFAAVLAAVAVRPWLNHGYAMLLI